MATQRVREIAEKQGLDAAKLSRLANLAYGTAWSLWNDPTYTGSVKTLSKIAKVLNCRISDLIIEENYADHR
jgi:transcriptional regulator with XRE-family HTH domain